MISLVLLTAAICFTQAPQLPVTKKNVAVVTVAWSADGKRITYTANDLGDPPKFNVATMTVYVVDADGKNKVQIPGQGFDSSFTHDGSGLIYGTNTNKAHRLNRYNFASKAISQVLDFDASAPACNPKNDLVAFTSTKEEADQQIYVMNADGSGVRQLTHGPGKAYNPQWSFDGKWITYFRELGDNKDQIYVMDANGENQRHLSKSDQHNFYPTFLPSGEVSYTNPPEPRKPRVLIVSPDGELRSEFPYQTSMLRWSPAGKAVFIHGERFHDSVFVSDRDGSHAVLITD